jgi:hypothetical protein
MKSYRQCLKLLYQILWLVLVGEGWEKLGKKGEVWNWD